VFTLGRGREPAHLEPANADCRQFGAGFPSGTHIAAK